MRSEPKGYQPVTDWRDYNSICTERYLGPPQGERRPLSLQFAHYYRRELHSDSCSCMAPATTMYHLQYTAQMMQAFIDAGKRSELMPYPRKTSMAHAAQTPVHRNERNSERELLGRP